MPIVDRTILKSYFETGDRPSQSEFEDLIDSNFNLVDDSSVNGWITYFTREADNITDQFFAFFGKDFSIPLRARSLDNLKLIWFVTPDSIANYTVTISIYYYSDIQNTDYANSSLYNGALYKHGVISEEIVLAGNTTSVTINELMAVDLPFLYDNVHFYTILLTLTDAQSANTPRIFGFEFS